MTSYQCCFYGLDIKSNENDVTSITVISNWDKEEEREQQFFCHLDCFKQRVAENVPVFLPYLFQLMGALTLKKLSIPSLFLSARG